MQATERFKKRQIPGPKPYYATNEWPSLWFEPEEVWEASPQGCPPKSSKLSGGPSSSSPQVDRHMQLHDVLLIAYVGEHAWHACIDHSRSFLSRECPAALPTDAVLEPQPPLPGVL